MIKKSDTKRTPSILNYLQRTSRAITKKLVFRNISDLEKKYYQMFSLAHRLDRIEKSAKYIDAWVVAVGIDPEGDREQYSDLRTIIPHSWLHEAEKEVLARPNPTQDRGQFKKEVAAKLKYNYTSLCESETAHLISLGAQLATGISKLIREYFRMLIEDINSHPDNTVMALEYYEDAKAATDAFLLTDSHHNIMYLPGKNDAGEETMDVLATKSAKTLMNKLRDLQAAAIINADPTANAPLAMSPRLKIMHGDIYFKDIRIAPAGQQPWLTGGGAIVPDTITYDQIKMRDGSIMTNRLWALIQLVFADFSDALADLQTKFSANWERSFLKKALKEDERRRAHYIFSECQIGLGNSETICTYHRLHDGNDHKNIHCKFSPCYLHAWKSYEISDMDTSGMTVTKIPGTRIHLNGECKLQQKYAKRLAESRHTFLYHDPDLNVVSQDGKVFEPAIRTDKSTADAAPGRNSKKRESTTFRRAKMEHSSTGSKASYLTLNQVRKQNNRHRSGSVRSSRASSRTRSSSRSSSRSSRASSTFFRPRTPRRSSRRTSSTGSSRTGSSHRSWTVKKRSKRDTDVSTVDDALVTLTTDQHVPVA